MTSVKTPDLVFDLFVLLHPVNDIYSCYQDCLGYLKQLLPIKVMGEFYLPFKSVVILLRIGQRPEKLIKIIVN